MNLSGKTVDEHATAIRRRNGRTVTAKPPNKKRLPTQPNRTKLRNREDEERLYDGWGDPEDDPDIQVDLQDMTMKDLMSLAWENFHEPDKHKILIQLVVSAAVVSKACDRSVDDVIWNPQLNKICEEWDGSLPVDKHPNIGQRFPQLDDESAKKVKRHFQEEAKRQTAKRKKAKIGGRPLDFEPPWRKCGRFFVFFRKFHLYLRLSLPKGFPLNKITTIVKRSCRSLDRQTEISLQQKMIEVVKKHHKEHFPDFYIQKQLKRKADNKNSNSTTTGTTDTKRTTPDTNDNRRNPAKKPKLLDTPASVWPHRECYPTVASTTCKRDEGWVRKTIYGLREFSAIVNDIEQEDRAGDKCFSFHSHRRLYLLTVLHESNALGEEKKLKPFCNPLLTTNSRLSTGGSTEEIQQLGLAMSVLFCLMDGEISKPIMEPYINALRLLRARNMLSVNKLYRDSETVKTILIDCKFGMKFSNKMSATLKKMAEQLVEDHKDMVPTRYEALKDLPGLTDCAASIVCREAFKASPRLVLSDQLIKFAIALGLIKYKQDYFLSSTGTDMLDIDFDKVRQHREDIADEIASWYPVLDYPLFDNIISVITLLDGPSRGYSIASLQTRQSILKLVWSKQHYDLCLALCNYMDYDDKIRNLNWQTNQDHASPVQSDKIKQLACVAMKRHTFRLPSEQTLSKLDQAIVQCNTKDEPSEPRLNKLLRLVKTNTCNYQDQQNQMSPLMVFAMSNRAPAVTKLLKLGANPWLRDKEGLTAMHYAVTYNQPDIIKLLFQHDKHLLCAKDDEGDFPQQYAVNQKTLHCIYDCKYGNRFKVNFHCFANNKTKTWTYSVWPNSKFNTTIEQVIEKMNDHMDSNLDTNQVAVTHNKKLLPSKDWTASFEKLGLRGCATIRLTPIDYDSDETILDS